MIIDESYKLTEEDVKNRYITPAIDKAGWKKEQCRMEFFFTDGQIVIDDLGPARSKERGKIDYLLNSKGGLPLAVVEAKEESLEPSFGLQQAKDYCKAVDAPFAYSTNGHEFVEFDFITGIEKRIPMEGFPSEDDLWNRYVSESNIKDTSISQVPFYYELGGKHPRYYQFVAVNKAVKAIENGQKRVLILMATGTGKTFVASQLIHKLLKSGRAKKILYVVDRNHLVDQSMANDFKRFQDEMIKVQNRELNSAFVVHFALYQQLVGQEGKPDPFLQLDPDFFDFVFIDECHRGSSKEDSEWHKVLDYFHNAVHVGMTATPINTDEASTVHYFGEPVYAYSYKQGVSDGFLAPFMLKDIKTSIDSEWYPEPGTVDDQGNPVGGPLSVKDYDRRISIENRIKIVAKYLVKHMMETDPYAKTIVFCVDIPHAERMRQAIAELVPEYMKENPDYVVRITGGTGDNEKVMESLLDRFTDKSSRYPVIATTSQLLTTGIDTVTVKNIVIDKNIGSATEFKQIIGRGSRLSLDHGKYYFTIIDARGASKQFEDPGWDGFKIEEPKTPKPRGKGPKEKKESQGGQQKAIVRGQVSVEIETEITRIYGVDGLTTTNVIDYSKKKLTGMCPTLEDFLTKWNSEDRKKAIIREFEEHGVLVEELRERLNRPDLDDFDMLRYIAYDMEPLTKTERVEGIRNDPYFQQFSGTAKEIIDTILDKYGTTPNQDISEPELLKLSEFNKFGGVSAIARQFGGRDGYFDTIKHIQQLLYSVEAQ